MSLTACAEWTGRTNDNGYPIDGYGRLLHRQVYHGTIPDGWHIDHLCRNKLCLNPFHLEAVTAQENIRRAQLARLQRTECRNGHPYEQYGSWVFYKYRQQWVRRCRLCANAWNSAYKRRRRKELKCSHQS